MWLLYAALSAIFAALTTIFAKIGVDKVDSTLATAIRTVVVLSGLATGISWLCYYKALQNAPASKVAPVDKFSLVITMILSFIVLKEQFSVKDIIGALLITAGTLVIIL